MSTEDLYCNPETNVFLQGFRKKNKSVVPPPIKKKKKKVPVPLDTTQELNNLFKSQLTKPSSLKKTSAAPPLTPRQPLQVNEEQNEFFKVTLRAVPSPFKTDVENSVCAKTEKSPLCPDPVDQVTPKYDPTSPPVVPRRTSKLISPGPVVESDKFIYPDEADKEVPTPLPPPECPLEEKPILPQEETTENILPPVVIKTPERRPLRPCSKPPCIPLSTFPYHLFDNNTSEAEEYTDDIYADEDEFVPEIVPPPADDSSGRSQSDLGEELYLDNDIDMTPPELEQSPPLEQSEKLPDIVPCNYDAVTSHGEMKLAEEEDVHDYPLFKTSFNLSPPECPIPPNQYPDDSDGEEDIYDDIDHPLRTPAGIQEEEGGDDIYDDFDGMDFKPMAPSPQPSPLLVHHNRMSATLPPPPKLPNTAPPPTEKLKQKKSFFGAIFKAKQKKMSEEELSSGQAADKEITNSQDAEKQEEGSVPEEDEEDEEELIQDEDESDDCDAIYEIED